MLSPSALTRTLIAELKPRFAELNFDLASDEFYGHRFLRSNHEVSEKVSVGCREKSGLLEVTLFIGVRFIAAEDLIAKHEDPNPLVTPQDLGERTTLGICLKGWTGEPTRWTLESVAQVPRCCNSIMRAFNKKGIPWLSKFREPQVALRFFEQPLRKLHEFAGTDEMIAQKAVACSLIFVGRDAARVVAERMRLQMSHQPAANIETWVNRLFSSLSQ